MPWTSTPARLYAVTVPGADTGDTTTIGDTTVAADDQLVDA